MPMLSERWPGVGTDVTAYRYREQAAGGGREALKCHPPRCASTSYRVVEAPMNLGWRLKCLGCGAHPVEQDRPSTCHMIGWDPLEAQEPPPGVAR